MATRTRSATILLEKAIASPQTIEDLKTNPVETLKKLEALAIQGLPAPNEKTASYLWLIVVIAFAIIVVYCAWVLGTGVTTKLDPGVTYAVRSDTILTVFTTVIGFLAGLLAPSPLSNSES